MWPWLPPTDRAALLFPLPVGCFFFFYSSLCLSRGSFQLPPVPLLPRKPVVYLKGATFVPWDRSWVRSPASKNRSPTSSLLGLKSCRYRSLLPQGTGQSVKNTLQMLRCVDCWEFNFDKSSNIHWSLSRRWKRGQLELIFPFRIFSVASEDLTMTLDGLKRSKATPNLKTSTCCVNILFVKYNKSTYLLNIYMKKTAYISRFYLVSASCYWDFICFLTHWAFVLPKQLYVCRLKLRMLIYRFCSWVNVTEFCCILKLTRFLLFFIAFSCFSAGIYIMIHGWLTCSRHLIINLRVACCTD